MAQRLGWEPQRRPVREPGATESVLADSSSSWGHQTRYQTLKLYCQFICTEKRPRICDGLSTAVLADS